jgi:hypothetical protein
MPGSLAIGGGAVDKALFIDGTFAAQISGSVWPSEDETAIWEVSALLAGAGANSG